MADHMNKRTGAVALVATIALWSSFALSTRAIDGSTLTTLDVALLRFGVPTVVLLPVLSRAMRAARREPAAVLALLAVGGLPHFLVFATGAHLTSAG